MTTPQDPSTRVQQLEAELDDARREEAAARVAARRCRVCGEPDEEAGGDKGYLTTFEVTLAEGEEGYSHIDSHLCEDCLVDVVEALESVGLGIHAHGGICFLEATDCPGREDKAACPTPEPQYPG